jgi:hypothetical protein
VTVEIKLSLYSSWLIMAIVSEDILLLSGQALMKVYGLVTLQQWYLVSRDNSHLMLKMQIMLFTATRLAGHTLVIL